MDILTLIACCSVVVFSVLCFLFLVSFNRGSRKFNDHLCSTLDHVDNEIDKLSASMAECIEEICTHIKLKNADKQPTNSEPN